MASHVIFGPISRDPGGKEMQSLHVDEPGVGWQKQGSNVSRFVAASGVVQTVYEGAGLALASYQLVSYKGRGAAPGGSQRMESPLR